MRGREARIAVAAAALVLLVPSLALAAFPGSDPTESPRVNTPNDPDFDRCEADDEDGPPTWARRGGRDAIRCGPGRDRAIVDRRDRTRGCERFGRR